MSLLAAQSRVVTPFAAGVQSRRSSSRPTAVQCAAGAREEAPQASRREAILRLAGLTALFAAAPGEGSGVGKEGCIGGGKEPSSEDRTHTNSQRVLPNILG